MQCNAMQCMHVCIQSRLHWRRSPLHEQLPDEVRAYHPYLYLEFIPIKVPLYLSLPFVLHELPTCKYKLSTLL